MSSVELHLQGPLDGDKALLDTLVEAGEGAERGGGIFAFASVRGIDSLLDDNAFRPLAKERGFQLIVGVDSITDEAALGALTSYSEKYAALTARVCLHETGMLFHPKLCWFATADRLTLVVGSGNLTAGGLMSNFEAFLVTTLEGEAAAAEEARIASMLDSWDAWLLQPDRPEAIARAKRNTGSERSLLKPMKPAPEHPEHPVPPARRLTCWWRRSRETKICELSSTSASGTSGASSGRNQDAKS